jgi:hypothetical protein
MAKYKIALICFKPNDIYLDFLNKFSNYEVYIIIDDNSVNYSALYFTKYNNLKFIQMPERICINYGFTNVNQIGVKKRVSGWDKALCYFAFTTNVDINTNENANTNANEKVWFIEDDVFFHSEDTMLKIDAKYPDCDLLSNCDFKPATNMNEWLWPIIQIKLEEPYYCGMMCAIRLSQNVLDRIRDYATLNKELFFLEALFPTLSKATAKESDEELNCCCPDELKTVVFRHDYTYEKVSLNKYKGIDNIYHPVKNILKHEEFRK